MSTSCLTSRSCRNISCAFSACILLIQLLAFPAFASDDVDQPSEPGLVEAVLEFIPDWTPSKAADEIAKAIEEHWQQTAPPGESIYSVTFSFDRGSWADFFSKPDIFLVVESEGNRKLLIPDIEYNWDYSPKVYTFRSPTFRPGSKCVLRLYDDDTGSDTVWKNIIASATSADWKVQGDMGSRAKTLGVPYEATAFIEVHAEASGHLRLLTASQAEAMVLDAPEVVAATEFLVPSEDHLRPWRGKGVFRKSGKEMGPVELTRWYTNPLPGPVRPFLRIAIRLAISAGLPLLLVVVAWLVYRTSRASPEQSCCPPLELLSDCPPKTALPFARPKLNVSSQAENAGSTRKSFGKFAAAFGVYLLIVAGCVVTGVMGSWWPAIITIGATWLAALIMYIVKQSREN